MRSRRSQEGAAAVEFGLVFPILMVVVFGIIAFGIVFAQTLALGNAARQGARYGVVGDRTCGELVDEVQTAATSISMQGKNVDVTVERGTDSSRTQICIGPATDVPCKGSKVGDNIYVRTHFESRLIIPLVVMDNTFDLGGQGTFRCEYS